MSGGQSRTPPNQSLFSSSFDADLNLSKKNFLIKKVFGRAIPERLFLCLKRDHLGPPITDVGNEKKIFPFVYSMLLTLFLILGIIFTDSGVYKGSSYESEPLPSGWTMVEELLVSKKPANLNLGSSDSRSPFLCVKREAGKDPIMDMGLYLPEEGESLPPGFSVVNRSVTGKFEADLNSSLLGPKSGKYKIFLVYRK
jgi:hypothetical protein